MPSRNAKLTTNKHGRDFGAHLKTRFDGSISKKSAPGADHKKPLSSAAVAAAVSELESRRLQAVAARQPGTKLAFRFGGSYRMVADADAQVRDVLYLEANHSPPNDSYVGTPYEAQFSYDERPAHAMLFYHHRAPRKSTGGLTSTGGSSFNKPWAEQLRDLMVQGKYAEAMALDFNDVLATTTPNRAYYALALHRTALYARNVGLLDDSGLYHVQAIYSQFLSGDEFAEAFTDADEAT